MSCINQDLGGVFSTHRVFEVSCAVGKREDKSCVLGASGLASISCSVVPAEVALAGSKRMAGEQHDGVRRAPVAGEGALPVGHGDAQAVLSSA